MKVPTLETDLSPAKPRYDGFISYSHRGERELARSLERTLWTFGRSWYQVRRIRTYRDETNLAAEPDLWPAIERAVRQSSCLILLASPDSAQSLWVPREVRTCIEARGIQGLCIVQTAGVLSWTDHISSQEMLSRPDGALGATVWQWLEGGVEPLVIDLRPFRGIPEKVRLRDPEYLGRVAAIAAKLLGTDKEDIWGAYHRAQRLRTVFLSVVSLLLLGLLIALGLVLRAEIQATRLAEENARKEREARRTVDRQLAETLLLTGDTLVSAGRWQQAKEIFAEARSKLIALGLPTEAADLALWEAYRHSPPPLSSFATQERDGYLALSADGQVLLTAGAEDHAIRIWNPLSGELLKKLEGHKNPVTVLTASSNHQAAISAEHGELRVWDLASGHSRSIATGESEPIHAARFLRGGSQALTVAEDGVATLWDLGQGTALQHYTGQKRWVSGMSVGPDSSWIFQSGTEGMFEKWDLDVRPALDAISLSVRFEGAAALSGVRPWMAWANHGEKTFQLHSVIDGKELHGLSGHTSSIDALAFSTDSEFLISGSEDRTVKLWDPETGHNLRTFTGHKTSVVAVAASRRLAASLDKSGQIFVWSLGADRAVRSFAGHVGPVKYVAISPDARFGVTSGGEDDAVLRLWELGSGKELAPFPRLPVMMSITSLTMSPDSRMVAAARSDQVILIEDLATRALLRSLPASRDKIVHLEFLSAAKLLSVSRDGSVRVFDARLGRLDQTMQAPSAEAVAVSGDKRRALISAADGAMTLCTLETGQCAPLPGQRSKELSVHALSFDGRQAVVAGDDYTLRLLDIDNGEIRLVLGGHSDRIVAASFAYDERLILSAAEDHTIRVFNRADGREMRTILADSEVLSMAFSARFRVALTGHADATVRVWDFSLPDRYRAFEEPLAALISARPAPKAPLDPGLFGKWLALRSVEELSCEALRGSTEAGAAALAPDAYCYWARGDFGAAQRAFTVARSRQEAPADYIDLILPEVRRAEQEPARLLRRLGVQISALAVAPRLPQIALASRTGEIIVLDSDSGRLLRRYIAHDGPVRALAYSRDGKWLASGGDDHIVRLWDGESGKSVLVMRGHNEGVQAVAFSANGHRVLSGDKSGLVIAWDASNGQKKRERREHRGAINALAVSPAEDLAISASDDDSLRVFAVERATGGTRVLVGHTEPVSALAITHDGARVISGGADLTLRVFDIKSARELLTIAGHRAAIKSVAVSEAGDCLLSGGLDHSLGLFSMRSGNLMQRFLGPREAVTSVVFLPGSATAISAEADGTVQRWNLDAWCKHE